MASHNHPDGNRKRRRLKKVTKDVKEQLEFYFGEANIFKSKHMKDLVGEDGLQYVPIDTILKFNKMIELKADHRIILRALENNDLLQLDDDSKMVRRSKPIKESYNAEPKTIYLDNLPKEATQDWVKELCLKIAPVAHIKCPKDRRTNETKQFAFVEFYSEKDAMKACALLNNPTDNFQCSMMRHYYKIYQRPNSTQLLYKKLRKAKKFFETRRDRVYRIKARARLAKLLWKTGKRFHDDDMFPRTRGLI